MTGDRNTKKGFTLVELMISVFIFSLIIGGVVNALLTSINLQRRILANQKMLAEVSFVLEYMGRTLRMARRDIGGACTELPNSNYAPPGGGGTIRFLNFDGDCQEFSWAGASINERIANTTRWQDLPPISLPITSNNVEVIGMVFNSAGSVWHSLGPTTNQSKVAIGLRIRPKIGDPVFFQTVVSQRKLNVPIQ